MTMTDPLRAALEGLRALSEAASAGPWQWLDGDTEHPDELQDGDGEMVATGFREDIVLDGKPLNRDGSLAAAAVNYVRAALATEARPGLDVGADDWRWECVSCDRPVPPMGMCETCGVFGVLRLTEARS